MTSPRRSRESHPQAQSGLRDYAQFADTRVKHLELIQDVISRLAGNGFVVKGWSLTVAGLLFGFAVGSRNAAIAGTAAFTILMFWSLDTYFIRCERLFRALYQRVHEHDSDVPPFFMAATSPEFVNAAPASARGWIANARRPALLAFHGTMILLAAVLTIAIACGAFGTPNPPPTDVSQPQPLPGIGQPSAPAASCVPDSPPPSAQLIAAQL